MTSIAVGASTPVVALYQGQPITTSQDVAAFFEKRHDHVIRDIRNLLQELPADHAPNFGEMVIPSNIGNGAVRNDPAYRMTRDGFTLLAMGFTGARALRFKLAYIDAFNKMEEQLRLQQQGEPTVEDLMKKLADNRWLLYSRDGRIELRRLEFDEFVTSMDNLAARINETLIHKPESLYAIISICAKKLAGSCSHLRALATGKAV